MGVHSLYTFYFVLQPLYFFRHNRFLHQIFLQLRDPLQRRAISRLVIHQRRVLGSIQDEERRFSVNTASSKRDKRGEVGYLSAFSKSSLSNSISRSRVRSAFSDARRDSNSRCI